MFVNEVHQENPRVASVVFSGEMPEFFQKRRVGQFLSLQIPTAEGWSRPHPFTISNAPEDDYLQITVKNVGLVTSAIHALKPGTELLCRGPFGSFCTDIEQKRESVMIAGGIGITPFLSVLRHFIRVKYDGNLTLIWANNEITDLFGRDELLEFTKQLDLRIIHVFANGPGNMRSDEPNFLFAEGLVSADFLRQCRLSGQAAYYLCGSPAMQAYVLNQLEIIGVDVKLVAKESFHQLNPSPR